MKLEKFKNIYIIISAIFIVWMLFLDANSWFSTHRELNKQIELLEEQNANLQQAIAKDKQEIQEFSTLEKLKKFARENYFMKKENEEIYIIEYADSLKTSDK
ncbi:cell division protein FtsL [Kordia sp. SMS9]|uniref:FtsB family cell division protein n=1 Tax=Kordia sp. SMS9 TaxID=2282170 RepID=UPI000E0D9249|nr:septum formation initiator family protein [Kordia sp. SMS9]AXG70392.1 cell division protein FtsL [Kordia sp. SMS9]